MKTLLETYLDDIKVNIDRLNDDQLVSLICYDGWEKEAAVNDYFACTLQDMSYADEEEAEEQKAWWLKNAVEVYGQDEDSNCVFLGTVIDCRF